MINKVGMSNFAETKGPESITYDGKEHRVRTVQDHNPLRCTLKPMMKDVVEINGKQYDVKETALRTPLNAERFVVIDGEKYNVHNETIGKLQTAILNGLDLNV